MSKETTSQRIGSVRLRAIRRTDRQLLHTIESEPAGNELANVFPRSDEEYAAHWDRIVRSPTIITRIIECRTDDAWHDTGFVTSFITEVSVGGESVDRRCVGYRLLAAWWNLGITSVALRMFIGDVLAERPLWAVTAAGNLPSQRVLSKNGFEFVEQRWSPATGRYPAGDEAVFCLG